jgi:hypothetical protein
MEDGYFFNTARFDSSLWFSEVSKPGQSSYQICMTSDGGLKGQQKAPMGFPLCERSLYRDQIMCLATSDLKTSITIDTSLTMPSGAVSSPSHCSQYCLIHNKTFMVIKGPSECSCGTSINIDVPSAGGSSNLIDCPRNTRDLQYGGKQQLADCQIRLTHASFPTTAVIILLSF